MGESTITAPNRAAPEPFVPSAVEGRAASNVRACLDFARHERTEISRD